MHKRTDWENRCKAKQAAAFTPADWPTACHLQCGPAARPRSPSIQARQFAPCVQVACAVPRAGASFKETWALHRPWGAAHIPARRPRQLLERGLSGFSLHMWHARAGQEQRWFVDRGAASAVTAGRAPGPACTWWAGSSPQPRAQPALLLKCHSMRWRVGWRGCCIASCSSLQYRANVTPRWWEGGVGPCLQHCSFVSSVNILSFVSLLSGMKTACLTCARCPPSLGA